MTTQAEVVSELIAEIESVLDRFYRGDYIKFDPDVYRLLAMKSATFLQAKGVLLFFLPKLDELNKAYHKEDSDLFEGYEKLYPDRLKNYLEFMFDICKDIRKYQENHRIKRQRKKRITKAANELTSKVTYQKEDTKLKLTSIPPSEIVGSSAVLLYNTKYETVAYLSAKNGGTLTVKGTTVYGYDEGISSIKNIPKYHYLQDMMNGNRTYVSEIMARINRKPRHLTGRIGENTIIMRVFKT